MSIVEALRTGLPLRRPIAKHKGSSRSGWLGSAFVLGLLVDTRSSRLFGMEHSNPFITETDLLADDWEVKDEQRNP